MKKKGFTITELLAVLVILAVLIIIGGRSVFKLISDSRKKVNEVTIKSVEDSALSYASKNVFIQDKCAINTLITDSNASSVTFPSGCSKVTVKIDKLITDGFFTDTKGVCTKSTNVIIYKYYYTYTDSVFNKTEKKYEVKAYVPTSACKS